MNDDELNLKDSLLEDEDILPKIPDSEEEELDGIENEKADDEEDEEEGGFM